MTTLALQTINQVEGQYSLDNGHRRLPGVGNGTALSFPTVVAEPQPGATEHTRAYRGMVVGGSSTRELCLQLLFGRGVESTKTPSE